MSRFRADRILASDIDRPDLFWKKVRKTPTCWQWMGSPNLWCYGYFSRPGHRTLAAHRVAYALEHGECPEGLVVRHQCDHGGCVRPSHLLIGTHADNRQDAIDRGRLPAHLIGCAECRKARTDRPGAKGCEKCLARRRQIESRRAHAKIVERRMAVRKVPSIDFEELKARFGERNGIWFARNNALYGFTTPETASAIAKEAGVSRERVRQILSRIAKRLGMVDGTFWSRKRANL